MNKRYMILTCFYPHTRFLRSCKFFHISNFVDTYNISSICQGFKRLRDAKGDELSAQQEVQVALQAQYDALEYIRAAVTETPAENLAQYLSEILSTAKTSAREAVHSSPSPVSPVTTSATSTPSLMLPQSTVPVALPAIVIQPRAPSISSEAAASVVTVSDTLSISPSSPSAKGDSPEITKVVDRPARKRPAIVAPTGTESAKRLRSASPSPPDPDESFFSPSRLHAETISMATLEKSSSQSATRTPTLAETVSGAIHQAEINLSARSLASSAISHVIGQVSVSEGASTSTATTSSTAVADLPIVTGESSGTFTVTLPPGPGAVAVTIPSVSGPRIVTNPLSSHVEHGFTMLADQAYVVTSPKKDNHPITGKKVYFCRICNAMDASKDGAWSHIREEHAQQILRCNGCQEMVGYNRESAKKYHIPRCPAAQAILDADTTKFKNMWVSEANDPQQCSTE